MMKGEDYSKQRAKFWRLKQNKAKAITKFFSAHNHVENVCRDGCKKVKSYLKLLRKTDTIEPFDWLA